jgi:hypothetical protein
MIKFDELSKLLDNNYDLDWEARICNQPDKIQEVLTDVDGPDLIKALMKRFGFKDYQGTSLHDITMDGIMGYVKLTASEIKKLNALTLYSYLHLKDGCAIIREN